MRPYYCAGAFLFYGHESDASCSFYYTSLTYQYDDSHLAKIRYILSIYDRRMIVAIFLSLIQVSQVV